MGADQCTLLTPGLSTVFERSINGDRRLNCTIQPPERLVDDEWQSLSGGPWVAKLMRPSRQPVAWATYRNFYVSITFDPHLTPLAPGGQIKFPLVAGAPAEGIVCSLPDSWTSRDKSFVFRLKLSKNGCTASTVVINQILHRTPLPVEDGSEKGDDGDGNDGGGNDGDGNDGDGDDGAVPLAAAAPEMVAAAAAAAGGAEEEEEGAAAEAAEAAEGQGDDASEGEVDARQAVIRSTHLEANLGLPDAQPDAASSLASLCRKTLCRSHEPLPGEGVATEEPPSTGTVPTALAAAMGASAEALALAAATAGGAKSDTDDGTEEIEEEEDDEPMAAAETAAVEDDAGFTDALPLPLPPPQPAPAALPFAPLSRSGRERKRKQHFGDNGEFDGPASSFRSAPVARKPSVSLEEETGVPAYALPGAEVWAMGLHAGVRKRFHAKVTGLRKQFPRIVVRYIATESGGTLPLELPDPVVAYLTMSDVEPGVLIQV